MDQPWPYNSVWLERDAPLARCPSPHCRRSGLCARMAVPWKKRLPCRRTHEHQDEMYDRLARKIRRFTSAMIHARKPGEPDPAVEPGSPEFEQRYAFLYNLIQARAAEYAAEAEAAQATKPRQKSKASAKGSARCRPAQGQV